MLTIAISLLFGLFAFAAVAQIYASVSHGALRGRLILAELARGQRRTCPIKPMRRLPATRLRHAPA